MYPNFEGEKYIYFPRQEDTDGRTTEFSQHYWLHSSSEVGWQVHGYLFYYYTLKLTCKLHIFLSVSSIA